MLELIDIELKQQIAMSHLDGYGQDLKLHEKQINTKTKNYKHNLGRDLTNTNLYNIFEINKDLLFDVKMRGFWELFLMLDKSSNILFTFMSEESLNKLLKDKTREIAHYVDILSRKNFDLPSKTQQLNLKGIKNEKFDLDELEQKLNELCDNLTMQNKNPDFRHAIITNKRIGNNIVALKAYIFNANLDLVEEENWSEYLKPGYESINDLDFKNQIIVSDSEIPKPTLKKEFQKPENDIIPQIKEIDNQEQIEDK